MKSFLLALLTLTATTFAGELHLAVVQYTTEKDPALLASGFADVNLFEATNADSVIKGDNAIRGGSVIFAQSLPASSGSRLTTSTRLGADRVEVTTSLNGTHVSAKITLFSGVDQALRSFTQRTYAAEGDVAGGRPVVISIQRSSGRSANNIKGKVSVKEVGYTTAIIAQYR